MSINPGRRHALKGVAALAAAGASGGVGLSFGQTRSLSATTYFGAWETAHRGILVPAFQKASGVKQVNLVPSLAVDTVSRIVASPKKPPFDAIILDEGPYIAALSNDIFEKVPALPNLKDIPKRFVDPRGLGVFVSAQILGITYNTERVKNPPKSWNDLLRPEYKGRIGLVGLGSTLGIAWMTELARVNGGGDDNLEPAFAWMKKVMPNVGAVAANPGALATMLAQGQIDITCHYNNNTGDLQAKGVPVKLIAPDSGFTMIRSTMHIVKNSPNADLAAEYLNQAISPSVQAQMAEAPNYLVPTNSRAPFSKGLQEYAKDMSVIEKMNTVDWAVVNPRRQEYIDRFNREVKA